MNNGNSEPFNDNHILDFGAVLSRLQSSMAGLSTEHAQARLLEYGRNELAGKKGKSRIQVFIGQFKDLMILLLIGAAIISFISGEAIDALVILAIIIANAIIGFTQEYRAEKALKMLQQMASPNALVMRNGYHVRINAAELVPGDIIELESGNIVPADARLISNQGIKTQEAALTGESFSVGKQTDPLTSAAVMPADQTNMVFKGTHISNGSGSAIVTATGMNTEMGKIAGMLEGDNPRTPLQRRLRAFGNTLVIIVLIICAIIFGLGIAKGAPATSMFLTALSLAVAALPEALPVVVTIALARGAARMVTQKALVRKLTAVEALGSVGYICSDKTGTLTQNVMTVEHTLAEEGRSDLLLAAMMLNHEVKKDEKGVLLGDPTETALISYAMANGLEWMSIQADMPIHHKIPFDSERMLMTTVHHVTDGWIVLVKGAPVRILEKLHSRHNSKKERWLAQNREWASAGFRVLFFAYKEIKNLPADPDSAILETDLDFLGMAALIDPPRAEVIKAIRQCHEAGITTIMITGDQPLTARSIAERLHIIEHSGQMVVTGAELLGMNTEQLNDRVKDIRVYARVSPGQKLTIIKALQSTGQSVAMTGDGINDAPSLKQADIGIAMGITGTDVAKEAAHMILLDDNFATIVKAIREGRRIYDNIRKFVHYILACNLGELLTILLAPAFGMPIPLLPIHILWINLVTDGLPGLALATEAAEAGIMKRKPRLAGESLFAGTMVADVVFTGLILAAGALVTQYVAISAGYGKAVQQTMVFTMLCFAQLGNALSVRAGRRSLFHRPGSNAFLLYTVGFTVLLQIAIVYVPFAGALFSVVGLDLNAMGIVCAITLGCIAAVEFFKRTAIVLLK